MSGGLKRIGSALALCTGLAWAQAPVPAPAPASAASAPEPVSIDQARAFAARLIELRQGGGPREQELSRAVDQAFVQAAELYQAGKQAESLARLEALSPDRPLASFPSFRIQMLAARAQSDLGNAAAASAHERAARTVAALLNSAGQAPERPLQLLHAMMIGDLVALGGGQAKPLEMFEKPGTGHLIALLFANDEAGTKTRYLLPMPVAGAAVVPGARYSKAGETPAGISPLMTQSIVTERQMLERHFQDRAHPPNSLETELRRAMAQADALIGRGQFGEALEALKSVAKLRDLDDIPHPPFLTRVSFVQGRLGNTAEQNRLRLKLFGLQRAIGSTGDGLSFETALEVPFLSIEYDWLADFQLKPGKQELVHRGDKHFDVIDVVDDQDKPGKRYFDVTRLFELNKALYARKP